MAIKGLRVISYQDAQKVEAGYNPCLPARQASHTSEALTGYSVFPAVFFCCLSLFERLGY